jgi:hypothetical protein
MKRTLKTYNDRKSIGDKLGQEKRCVKCKLGYISKPSDVSVTQKGS